MTLFSSSTRPIEVGPRHAPASNREPGLVATVEIAGLDPEFMKEGGRRVTTLANLAVDDERTVADTRKVIAQRVERKIDAAGDGPLQHAPLTCGHRSASNPRRGRPPAHRAPPHRIHPRGCSRPCSRAC